MALLNKRPHAVMLPFPAQGHINGMMPLAQILYARGFYITFVNTQYIQERLTRSGSLESVKSLHDFRLEIIPDGLPPEHGRTSKIAELCRSFTDIGPLHFDKLMDKLKHSEAEGVPPVTCIISDGFASFPQKIARKLGVPTVSFWTHGACGFSGYFSGDLLAEKGYIPLKDEGCLPDGYMEQIIPCLPGMPQMRIKDLAFSLRRSDMSEFVRSAAQAALEADLVIINTFEELEGPVLDALRHRIRILYSIGPLGLLAESMGNDKIPDISVSTWTEEVGCVKWLDGHKPSSVIYVCFGSIAVMSEQELLELAWGLEATKLPFLWVIRPDLIHGQSAVLPAEFLEKVKDRGLLVRWAPQMKVLLHPSVRGFLTHNGWNSTLESICAGVPMISWPFLAEQPTNRKFVCDVWKIGMAMNEVVNRELVQDIVTRLMRGEEGQQMRKKVGELRGASIRALEKGGSSYNNMEKFVQEIQSG